MPIVSVVLGRDELGLPPLEIGTDPHVATYWLAEAPTGWPHAPRRRGPLVPAPRRPRWDATLESLAVPRPRLGDLELPLTVLVSAASGARLYAARTLLIAAFGQRGYDVVVQRRGQRPARYRASATHPRWSPPDTFPPAALPPGLDRRTLRAQLRIPLTAPARPSAPPAIARPA